MNFKRIHILFLFVFISSFCLTNSLSAAQCSQFDTGRWIDRSTNPDNSPCGGRSIDRDKRRDGRNLRLECGSSVDHYMRRPLMIVNENSIDDQMLARASWAKSGKEVLDELYWAEEKSDWQKHQKIMMEIYPDIKWSGRVDYATYEVWEWTACEWGLDPVCPDRVYYVDVPVYDDKGNQIGTTQEERREPEPCWHDEDYTERKHCSYEQMTYDAKFHKYTASEWNPSSPGYYPIIANKDNLLACEFEDVQFFNTTTSLLSSSGTVLKPAVEVGDAWNVYSPNIVFTKGVPNRGATTAACLYDHDYHVSVEVFTDKRLTNKTTPNCLRVPVDEFGEELPSPFTNWTVANDNGTEVRLKPTQVGLTDGSSLAIDALSRQSRKFESSVEQEKQKRGKGANKTKEQQTRDMQDSLDSSDQEVAGGFWKDTHLQLILYEQDWAFRRRKTEPLEVRGAEVVPFRDTKGLDQYRISLEDFYHASNWKPLEYLFDLKTDLVPGRTYYMDISMFQEAVPFYKQSKWTGGKAWSEPIAIKFERVDGFDQRGSFNRFRNWLSNPFWLKLVNRPF